MVGQRVVTLRLDEGFKEQLARAAEQNERSLNSEIAARLVASFLPKGSPVGASGSAGVSLSGSTQLIFGEPPGPAIESLVVSLARGAAGQMREDRAYSVAAIINVSDIGEAI